MASVIEAIINFIFPVIYVLWRIVAFIFLLIWKVVTDLFKNIYGRAIVALGGIIFAYLAYLFTTGHL